MRRTYGVIALGVPLRRAAGPSDPHRAQVTRSDLRPYHSRSHCTSGHQPLKHLLQPPLCEVHVNDKCYIDDVFNACYTSICKLPAFNLCNLFIGYSKQQQTSVCYKKNDCIVSLYSFLFLLQKILLCFKIYIAR